MRRIVLSVLDASRSDRVSRFTLGCTVALGLVLVLSASGFSDDDNDCDDDDDNSCCRCAPAYVACAPCQPAGFAPQFLCPKKLNGKFGDTYWYDGWKGTLISHCGGLIYDLPHDEDVEVGCNGVICKNLIEVQLLGSDRPERKPQKRYCVAGDTFVPDNPKTVSTELGTVRVPEPNSTGRVFYFRVLQLRTPGERTRYIGMEIQGPKKSNAGQWHPVPAIEHKKHVHRIDARLLGATRTITVTTYRAVQW